MKILRKAFVGKLTNIVQDNIIDNEIKKNLNSTEDFNRVIIIDEELKDTIINSERMINLFSIENYQGNREKIFFESIKKKTIVYFHINNKMTGNKRVLDYLEYCINKNFHIVLKIDIDSICELPRHK